MKRKFEVFSNSINNIIELTPDLLIEILLFLDFKNIIVVAKVNSLFRKIIKSESFFRLIWKKFNKQDLPLDWNGTKDLFDNFHHFMKPMNIKFIVDYLFGKIYGCSVASSSIIQIYCLGYKKSDPNREIWGFELSMLKHPDQEKRKIMYSYSRYPLLINSSSNIYFDIRRIVSGEMEDSIKFQNDLNDWFFGRDIFVYSNKTYFDLKEMSESLNLELYEGQRRNLSFIQLLFQQNIVKIIENTICLSEKAALTDPYTNLFSKQQANQYLQ